MEKIHLDHFQVQGRYYIVGIDGYSEYTWVSKTKEESKVFMTCIYNSQHLQFHCGVVLLRRSERSGSAFDDGLLAVFSHLIQNES